MKCELKLMKKDAIKYLKSINKFDIIYVITMIIIWSIIIKFASIYLAYIAIGISLLILYLIEYSKCKESIKKGNH